MEAKYRCIDLSKMKPHLRNLIRPIYADEVQKFFCRDNFRYDRTNSPSGDDEFNSEFV